MSSLGSCSCPGRPATPPSRCFCRLIQRITPWPGMPGSGMLILVLAPRTSRSPPSRFSEPRRKVPMRAFPRVLAVLAVSVLAVVLLPTARSEAVMGQFIFDSANTSVYLSFSSATVGSFIFTSDPSSGRNFYIHHAGWAGNGEEEVYIETYNGLPVAGADCNG